MLTQQKDASDLWPFTKKMLLLSHGQATVERVFSVNKELLADNMGGNTLVAQRVICDHVHSLGGSAVSVKITPELLTSAAAGRQRYQAYLDSFRKTTTESIKL